MSALLERSQEWIKAALPRPLLERIRAYRHRANVRKFEAGRRKQAREEWRLLLRHWRQQAAAAVAPAAAGPAGRRTLVFPSDPGAIVGSRGDDAMIAAVVQAARSAAPDVEIDMLCEGEGVRIAQEMGFRPVAIGPDRDFPAAVAQLLAQRRYDHYVALGADIIDGRFGPRIPALMLIAADLAARTGTPATILGCSFGADPAPELGPVFRGLDPRARLNMRDPVSLQRVAAFAPVQPRQVADAAFTLRPGRVDAATAAWIAEQRSNGRRVVGVNVHPMLVKNPEAGWIEAMVASLGEALAQAGAQRELSWLLLPHDYRAGFGDLECLEQLDALLRARGGVDARLLAGTHSAADLKAVVGQLDAVITGRMHLAIAALGMGVPPLALTYHDKFEGLYRLFELPSSLLLAPVIFDDPAQLARRIEAFTEGLPAFAATIRRRHDAVMELAWENFVAEPPAAAASLRP